MVIWNAENFSSGDFGLEGDWAAEDIDLTSDGGAIIAIDNGNLFSNPRLFKATILISLGVRFIPA